MKGHLTGCAQSIDGHGPCTCAALRHNKPRPPTTSPAQALLVIAAAINRLADLVERDLNNERTRS